MPGSWEDGYGSPCRRWTNGTTYLKKVVHSRKTDGLVVSQQTLSLDSKAYPRRDPSGTARYADQLGWFHKGQWGGINSSQMECMGI